MRRSVAPLIVDDDLIGLLCPGCAQPFEPGDVVRSRVIRVHGTAPIQVDAVVVHLDCLDPGAARITH